MKHKISRHRFFLDTSVIIHRATRAKGFVESKIPEWGNADLYTSYYVLYEFLTGIIRTAVEYYMFIKLYNGAVEDALSAWSDNFKIRELKNTQLIESTIYRLDKSASRSTKTEYLSNIEGAIIFLWKICRTDLKGIIGDFGSHEIFNIKFQSADDFALLAELIKKHKHIDLCTFWIKHKDELLLMVNHLKSKKAELGGLAFFLENLDKILQNPKSASKQQCSRKSSDAVIAVEPSNTMELLSFDGSFSFLCPALLKKHRKLPK